ncbi:MAG: aminoacyl-tRNA hydrolase [Rhodospirillales bacterium]|nr:aminoacyl-tRNA hydrolase [Alphaproteobacteria bacterium]MBL6947611.1 aminoacyl-tRNA hydrolase [Rhodospirillales bacterium]
MLLLVGLGNPGSEYAKNRHNIGFMAIDVIAERFGFQPFRKKFHGLLSEGLIDGAKVLALKPETFMNDSGRAVAAACAFYKIAPEDIIVLHDEIDLDAAKVRVKRGGGHAGHNGLRSIHGHIGPDYGRVRLGIGHPGDKDRVTGHVLNDFSKADGEWLDKLLAAIADHAALLMDAKDADFMSRVAADVNPPRNNKPKTKNETDNENGL